MTPIEFNELLDRRLLLIKNVLESKSKEYASTTDKLHNFKRAAQINNTHPARELHGFLTKHLVSYLDILNKVENGEYIPMEIIDEKLGDIINYFILQEAVFSESNTLNKTQVNAG